MIQIEEIITSHMDMRRPVARRWENAWAPGAQDRGPNAKRLVIKRRKEFSFRKSRAASDLLISRFRYPKGNLLRGKMCKTI